MISPMVEEVEQVSEGWRVVREALVVGGAKEG
jgi:hypothetical protein